MAWQVDEKKLAMGCEEVDDRLPVRLRAASSVKEKQWLAAAESPEGDAVRGWGRKFI